MVLHFIYLISYVLMFIYLCWSSQELLEAYEAEGKATGKQRLMLSAAVPAGKGTIDAGFEIAEVAK